MHGFSIPVYTFPKLQDLDLKNVTSTSALDEAHFQLVLSRWADPQGKMRLQLACQGLFKVYRSSGVEGVRLWFSEAGLSCRLLVLL